VTDLHVHESGTPGSPAIVFLHGVGNSGGMWASHRAGLTGYHCLAPDLPGFGRSNRVPWRSRIHTAELVADLIAHRVPARRAHVVGGWRGPGGAVARRAPFTSPIFTNPALFIVGGLGPGVAAVVVMRALHGEAGDQRLLAAL
jgi:pimeloyl-ACP methyl ester carboxylesterase